MSLRVSQLALEGIYQGSKFLKIQVLCDREELKALFERLGEFWLFHLTGLGDGEPIGQERFLEEYGKWVEGLKRGEVVEDGELKKVLAAALTKDLNALWKQEAGGKFLVKMARPVVQVQAHFFTYSAIDGVFRPMTMGAGSIFWGLQFSFPQIYQDPKTMEFFETDLQLFEEIRRWMRDFTRPTPFVVGGVKTNVPIRLGKNCFSWIGAHPQLKGQGISVA
jgi:hypothetical protein